LPPNITVKHVATQFYWGELQQAPPYQTLSSLPFQWKNTVMGALGMSMWIARGQEISPESNARDSQQRNTEAMRGK